MAITLSGTDGVDQADVSGATTIPRGTTAERPANPADGMIRYNTDEEYIEYYNSDRGEWLPSAQSPGPAPVQATGGTVTEITDGGVNYRVHTFTSVGASSFQVTQGGDVEYLIVAGGGGGGDVRTGDVGSAGGGAGGYRSSVVGQNSGGNSPAEPLLSVTPQSYSVIVGSGGAKGVATNNPGSNGANSSFAGIVSLGGGGGGGTGAGNDGGSGGGGGYTSPSTSGTAGQGFGGGAGVNINQDPGDAGGGGGAGEVGETPPSLGAGGGDGGDGLPSNITGTTVYRAGGGGGGNAYNDMGSGGLGGGAAAGNGNDGVPNTGGGGGGTRSALANGGNGGSGIVIIRYPI